MEMAENLEKAKEFLSRNEMEIELNNGDKHKYMIKVGIGRAMDATACLCNMLGTMDMKFEDLFPSTGQTLEEEIKEFDISSLKKRMLDLLQKGIPSPEFRDNANQMISIITKLEKDQVYEQVDIIEGIMVIINFFLKNIVSVRGIMMGMFMASNSQIPQQQEESDSEKSSLGELPKEESDSITSTNS